MAELQRAQVDLTGLLAVLGSHLYSAPEVALRELVQNAHDSCTRRRLEDVLAEARIEVIAEPEAGLLRFIDNGAGLTREEIVRYLATLGAGYTRLLRERSDDLIGAFGLGFLTAYGVSQRVVVTTCSYQTPGETWVFTSLDGSSFTLDVGAPRPVGTEVCLHLKPDLAHLGRPERVRQLLSRYCALLQHPVLVPDRPVNADPPPWSRSLPPAALRSACLAWAERFEHRFRPLVSAPLVDLPHGAGGLFWVQDGGRYASSDNRQVSVFVRGMLVSAEAHELLPDWAGFCGAVISCDALQPTASREDIQKDTTFSDLKAGVRAALVKGLAELSRTDEASWSRILRRHNEALLGAALEEGALYAMLEGSLRVPTSEGALTVPEVHRASPQGLLLAGGESLGYEQVLYRAVGRPVIDGTRYAVVPFVRQYAAAHNIPVIELGTTAGDETLFRPASVGPGTEALLQELLGSPEVKVVAASFAPSALPVVLVPDREAALKRTLEDEKADARIASGLLGLARMYTASLEGGHLARLYVNLDNPVVARLVVARGARQRHAAVLLKSLAALSSRDRVEGATVDVLQTLQELTAALEGLL